jgi:hypothetical protein
MQPFQRDARPSELLVQPCQVRLRATPADALRRERAEQQALQQVITIAGNERLRWPGTGDHDAADDRPRWRGTRNERHDLLGVLLAVAHEDIEGGDYVRLPAKLRHRVAILPRVGVPAVIDVTGLRPADRRGCSAAGRAARKRSRT